MARTFFERLSKIQAHTAAFALTLLSFAFLASVLAAQQQAPAAASQSAGTPGPSAGVPAKPSAPSDQPSMPIDQIIARFAEREAEFKIERDNYTYTQSFTIQTLDNDDRPDGEYTMTSDIIFSPDGKRTENVTYAPQPTLERISLSQQDLDDLEHVQPFVLTTAELPKYDVKYVDKEQLDELNTYVFDVAPKRIEKNQRYFQGRIWVDDKDFAVVKTDGKAVPDIKKRGEENVFPRFETFRENIEGHYWFPTYTRSNDTLHFTGNDVRIKMTVRYTNYKRFGVTTKIGAATQIEDKK